VTISAQLTDASGNAVATSGKTVTWSKSNANGSFATAPSTTDSSGIATISFTTHTVVATATTVTATDGSGFVGTTPTITTAYTVGDTGPGGGKIFYYNAAGFNCVVGIDWQGTIQQGTCHYLEAAPNGWFNILGDPLRTWATNANSNQSNAVDGADRTGIGEGYLNSLDIKAQVGNDAGSSAAVDALDYNSEFKSDWYLPSKDELSQLYLQKAAGKVGGFVEGYYWSSTEYDPTNAWYQYFNGGSQHAANKTNAFYVRPVRAF
jgi:hypothetical protein